MSYNQYFWQEQVQDLEIQNSLQIIIPEENYGYGVNDDSELYGDMPDLVSDDEMPDLVSDDIPDNEWAMPGDADWIVTLHSFFSTPPSPNSEVP